MTRLSLFFVLVDCLFAFTESSNTGIPGGLEQPGIGNVTECKQACVFNQSCVGIDWSPNNGPGHQCYLHSTTGTRFIWMGVFHYDLDTSVCNPPIGNQYLVLPRVTSSIYLSINTFTHPSIHLSIRPSIHPSIHPCIHQSLHSSTHSFLSPCNHPSIHS